MPKIWNYKMLQNKKKKHFCANMLPPANNATPDLSEVSHQNSRGAAKPLGHYSQERCRWCRWNIHTLYIDTWFQILKFLMMHMKKVSKSETLAMPVFWISDAHTVYPMSRVSTFFFVFFLLSCSLCQFFFTVSCFSHFLAVSLPPHSLLLF